MHNLYALKKDADAALWPFSIYREKKEKEWERVSERESAEYGV